MLSISNVFLTIIIFFYGKINALFLFKTILLMNISPLRRNHLVVFWKKSSSSKCHKIQSTHLCLSLFLRTLHAVGLHLYSKETLTQVLSAKFAEQLFLKYQRLLLITFFENSNLKSGAIVNSFVKKTITFGNFFKAKRLK